MEDHPSWCAWSQYLDKRSCNLHHKPSTWPHSWSSLTLIRLGCHRGSCWSACLFVLRPLWNRSLSLWVGWSQWSYYSSSVYTSPSSPFLWYRQSWYHEPSRLISHKNYSWGLYKVLGWDSSPSYIPTSYQRSVEWPFGLCNPSSHSRNILGGSWTLSLGSW